jgi:hypothetical protein
MGIMHVLFRFGCPDKHRGDPRELGAVIIGCLLIVKRLPNSRFTTGTDLISLKKCIQVNARLHSFDCTRFLHEEWIPSSLKIENSSPIALNSLRPRQDRPKQLRTRIFQQMHLILLCVFGFGHSLSKKSRRITSRVF